MARLTARGVPGHSAEQLPPGERAGVILARAMAALADADLFAQDAHPIDGTRPTVNIGTMISGGITPFMHPESMTAIVEVRVIEGMTMAGVHDELCSAPGPGRAGGPRRDRRRRSSAGLGAAELRGRC